MDIETWRYSLPNVKGAGWAIIFMDSIGCFTALSDWGDVGYRWPEKGWGDKDFRLFVLGLDDSYLIGKLGRGKREYDREGTLAAVKARIEELTDEKVIDGGQREHEYELIRRYGDLYSEGDFQQWYTETEIEDASELHCMGPCSDVVMFVKNVMPRLRETLKQDLKL